MYHCISVGDGVNSGQVPQTCLGVECSRNMRRRVMAKQQVPSAYVRRSYWKWQFILSNMVSVHSFVNIYQRVFRETRFVICESPVNFRISSASQEKHEPWVCSKLSRNRPSVLAALDAFVYRWESYLTFWSFASRHFVVLLCKDPNSVGCWPTWLMCLMRLICFIMVRYCHVPACSSIFQYHRLWHRWESYPYSILYIKALPCVDGITFVRPPSVPRNLRTSGRKICGKGQKLAIDILIHWFN